LSFVDARPDSVCSVQIGTCVCGEVREAENNSSSFRFVRWSSCDGFKTWYIPWGSVASRPVRERAIRGFGALGSYFRATLYTLCLFYR
jgi:hypothetical protein